MKAVVAVGVTTSVPEVGLLPVQLVEPEAMQPPVALVDDQVSVEELPESTLVGFAAKFSDGAPGLATVTVTTPVTGVVPATPAHANV